MNQELTTRILVASVDFITCFVSLLLALAGLYGLTGEITPYLPAEQIPQRMLLHAFVAIVAVTWFWFVFRHYTHRKPFWAELREVLRLLLILAILELALIAFAKSYSSRYLWALTWLFVSILVPLGRITAHALLLRYGWLQRETVIIGHQQNAVDTYMALQSEPYLGLDIKAFVSESNQVSQILGVPVISDKERLLEKYNTETTQFVLALEQDEFESRYEWLQFFSKHRCRRIFVVPALRGIPLHGTDISFLFSYDVMLLRVSNNLARLSARWVKRAIDIIGSLCIMVLLSPFLLLLMLLIAIDAGMPIYAQIRIGRDRKVFKCYKFRSMKKNADQQLKDILDNDPKAREEWEKDYKLKNDPRITRLGRFIRATSLDELPQLWNVLKGDMSLVGPRPIVRQELPRYKDDLDYYLMIRPGMTGLWQVSGRNDVDYETRVFFDAWYVRNWSIWNDITILCKTVAIVIKRSGAY